MSYTLYRCPHGFIHRPGGDAFSASNTQHQRFARFARRGDHRARARFTGNKAGEFVAAGLVSAQDRDGMVASIVQHHHARVVFFISGQP